MAPIRRRSVHTALHFSTIGKQTSGPKLRRNGPIAVFDWPPASRCTRFRQSRKLRTRKLEMRTNAKLTTCAIVGVCLIFTQLHPGLLAQDNPNGPLIASIDNEGQSDRDQVVSANGRSGEVPASAPKGPQTPPPIKKPTPRSAQVKGKRKTVKSQKRWLQIGGGMEPATTPFRLIKRPELERQVPVATPSVGVPR